MTVRLTIIPDVGCRGSRFVFSFQPVRRIIGGVLVWRDETLFFGKRTSSRGGETPHLLIIPPETLHQTYLRQSESQPVFPIKDVGNDG
jgi:hypothetical protein